MVEFADGRAMGVKLNLSRTPKYMRVVTDVTGNVDALDLPKDRPVPSEDVFAYQLIDGTMSRGFLCGKKLGGCTIFTKATYQIIATQPPEDVLRSNKKWFKWVKEIENS